MIENLEQALDLHRSNNFVEAEKVYKTLLTNESDNVVLMYFFSLLLYQTSRLDEACQYLNQIVELKPGNQVLTDSLNLLGEIYLIKNEITLAEKYFLEALDEDSLDFVANNNLGKIYLSQKDYDKAIEYSEKALEVESNHIELYQNLIQAYFQKNDTNAIINCYLKLIELEPSNPCHYFDIATYYSKKMDAENACRAYLYAISLNPNYAAAHINLGNLYHKYNDLKKAKEHLIEALKLDNSFLEVYNSLGNLYIDLGEPDKAIEISQKGLELFKDSSDLKFNIAKGKLLKGNIIDGWEYFKYRRIVNEKKGLGKYLLDYQGPLKDKKVLVYSDTGFGDSIQFARYLPLLEERGAVVKCKVQNALVPLLKENMANCEFIPASIPDNEVELDYHINLTSLSYLFKPGNGKIHSSNGYLKADLEKVKAYKEKYFDSDCFKLGISWQGSGVTPIQQLNNIKHVEAFIPFTRLENVKVYSVLKGPAEKQLSELPENVEIVNLGETFKDFSDTAAALENLDLLIVSDAAYSHLAGALGKPTWIMIPFVSNWRWFADRRNSLWYDSIKLFRQQEPGNWDKVLERLYSELKLKLFQ